VPEELFRRHICRGSNGHPFIGQPRLFFDGNVRETEIKEGDSSKRVDENISGGNIPMNNALVVNKLKRLQERHAETNNR
jgi:hypothetical protein